LQVSRTIFGYLESGLPASKTLQIVRGLLWTIEAFEGFDMRSTRRCPRSLGREKYPAAIDIGTIAFPP